MILIVISRYMGVAMGFFGRKKPKRTSDETIALVKQRLFESSDFEDLQHAFEIMEANYLKLRQLKAADPDAVIQLTADWAEYAQALSTIKASLIYVAEDTKDLFEGNFQKGAEEALQKASQIEASFKQQLGTSFEPIPQIDITQKRDINLQQYFRS